MIPNSTTYFLFVPVVYLIYWLAPKRQRNLVLLIASYLFYTWWDARLLSLIVISTAINYCCGLAIKNGESEARHRLTASFWIIIACLLSLAIHFGLLAKANSLSWHTLEQSLLHDEMVWIVLGFLCLSLLFLNVGYSRIKSRSGSSKKDLSLIAGVIANLVILGFFKYYNFFVDNIAWVIRGMNLDPGRFYLHIVLPVGISFYTFKGISYIIDVSRNQIEPEKRYVNFALFLGFFPSLLAGPIDRAKNLLPQFSSMRKQTVAFPWEGLHLILYGLFKKVVIADGVVRSVNSVFNSSGQTSWIDIIAATTLFTIQIYCDFSGYTDMARGTAKLFGIDLMINFNLPYFSKSPREFWNRWHISLSTWLRDYLYIPLGGNRLGKIKTYRNLILTMVLGGLWHGAAWNFVFWGLYHGLALGLHRVSITLRDERPSSEAMMVKGFKMAVCFVAVAYGWLLFRAPSLDAVLNLSSKLIFDFGNIDLGIMRPKVAAVLGIVLLAGIEMIEYWSDGEPFYKRLPMPAWTALYSLIVFALLMGLGTESTQFIYFNF
jgi:alginate O-acetyltransferase complex protein AlgI